MFIGIVIFIVGMFIATQNTQSKIAWPMVVVGLALFATGAHAQHSGHPPEHQSLHDRFYRDWKMPDNRAVSCCSDKDCAPAQSKFENGSWYARHTDAEVWHKIPAYKVEHDRDSPDGRSHLCGVPASWSETGYSVFCFLPASGS